MREPDVCYTASTTASLLTHHDINHVKSVLNSMILNESEHEDKKKKKVRGRRAPIGAVISTIIDSLYYNFSRLGHKAEELAQELGNFYAHLVKDEEFV